MASPHFEIRPDQSTSPEAWRRVAKLNQRNQCCVQDADFESIVLGQIPKIPFSTASVRNCYTHIEHNRSGLPLEADV
jgi:hypothetical protein